ncbi:MAG: hypothetical protein K8F60_00970 [Melioribacteraceae bacterium]|nr:hypothetical protein [Melioribacteraceae bacterium]
MAKLKLFVKISLLNLLFLCNYNFGQGLDNYDFSKAEYSVDLPKELKEISGLTIGKNERVFAHNDEYGMVYELNPNTGQIIKEFQIGSSKIKDDFEDITFVNDLFYLLNSKGDLLVFPEADNKEFVIYKKYRTGLNSKYDTEGLCYDKSINSLLIASKESVKKSSKKYIFRFDLQNNKLNEEPFLVIDLSKIKKGKKKEEFKPSAIIKNEKSNTYFILGGKSLALIELNRKSEIINQIELNDKYHFQPEGMIILKNGDLLISDEAEKKKGSITLYKSKKDSK